MSAGERVRGEELERGLSFSLTSEFLRHIAPLIDRERFKRRASLLIEILSLLIIVLIEKR